MESSLNNKIKNQAADIGQLSQRLEIIYKGLKALQEKNEFIYDLESNLRPFQCHQQ